MWIETKHDGWLNLDRATSIKRGKDGWLIRNMDGELVGTVSGHYDLDEMMGNTIVPASAGQEAVLVEAYPDETSAQVIVDVERATIVAWRIDHMGAFPILAGEPPAPSASVLIVHPDGRCSEPFVGAWRSVEAAVEDTRKEAQSALDIRRAREQAAIE